MISAGAAFHWSGGKNRALITGRPKRPRALINEGDPRAARLFVYLQGQLPIGLVTLAVPFAPGSHIGGFVSLPTAVPPFVAKAVTTVLALLQVASATAFLLAEAN